jgi:hypothetical protein
VTSHSGHSGVIGESSRLHFNELIVDTDGGESLVSLDNEAEASEAAATNRFSSLMNAKGKIIN